jgi:hypothetical protein
VNASTAASRERRAIGIVVAKTGEPRTVVLQVLHHMSHDASAAISAIELAQFYEREPVAFARSLQREFSAVGEQRRCA